MINKQLSVLQGSKGRGAVRPDNGKRFNANNPITDMMDDMVDEAASFLPSEVTGAPTRFQSALSGMANPSSMKDPSVSGNVMAALRAVTMGLTEPIAGPQPGPWTDAYKRPMETGVKDSFGEINPRMGASKNVKLLPGEYGISQPILTPQQQGAVTKLIRDKKSPSLPVGNGLASFRKAVSDDLSSSLYPKSFLSNIDSVYALADEMGIDYQVASQVLKSAIDKLR